MLKEIVTIQQLPGWLLRQKQQEAEEESSASFATAATTLVLTILSCAAATRTDGDLDLAARIAAFVSFVTTGIYLINAIRLEEDASIIKDELTSRRLK